MIDESADGFQLLAAIYDITDKRDDKDHPRIYRQDLKSGVLDEKNADLTASQFSSCLGQIIVQRFEPSLGIAPRLVADIFAALRKINQERGMTMLIVEQNVQQVLRVVDRAYLLEAGSLRASGTAAEMMSNDTIKQAYLGV